MTDDGADHDRGDPVVARDRRIDPRAGTVRSPEASAPAERGQEEVTVSAPDSDRDTVTGADGAGTTDQDSAIGGVPTSGADVPGDAAATSTVDEPVAGPDLADVAAGAGANGADGELTRLRTELEERTADLQRVSAEYANYRRRVERDREGTVAGAKASVAGELMTVLDDVARAEQHGDLTGPFKVVADRLTETLDRVGLAPFGTEGDPFDPTVHEAVAHETSAEVSGPTVSTVMRRGYRFGERVLRPAMVAVVDADPDAPGVPPAAVGDGSAPVGSPSATNPDAG